MSTFPFMNNVESRRPPPGNIPRADKLVEPRRFGISHYCGWEIGNLTTSFGALEKKVEDLARSSVLRGSSGGVEANVAEAGAAAEDDFEPQPLNEDAVPEATPIEVDTSEAARDFRKQEHIRLMAMADKTIREARRTIIKAEKTISDVKESLAADFDRLEREREARVSATRYVPPTRQPEGSDEPVDRTDVAEEGEAHFDYMNVSIQNTNPISQSESRTAAQANGGSSEGGTLERNVKRQISMLESGTSQLIGSIATSEPAVRDEQGTVNQEDCNRASKRPRLN
ncbi:uncharacterized protein PGTG_04618 [Puccinia graminis f. sp. tritici CRL 75-36-700-3]|uniref:Uncharacterized protein n=1 Tax=Puccinia graminis f. sp. tritici (strain CRL 75-36-700-3 / race SCCL) TaxID=418459 RepID=E3K2U3_PUCGT|nr:uncharacterized protein PGTG_04618 [Puccinia graminis f. sp. tritici CRL 75-36-700-3]EFP78662.2 hypothetical protein PGTG_04618 [Puccinia graminis f. sp. tritici CRL 75-36-700-3]